MKLNIVITIYCLLSSFVYAQKRVLTDTSFRNWKHVSGGAISNNGKFVSYTINNEPKGSSTFVVLSKDQKWIKRFVGLQNTRFSPDSKYVFGIKGGDTLLKIKLYTEELTALPSYTNYSIFSADRSDWLAYRPAEEKTLIIENLHDGSKRILSNVQDYIYNQKGACMLLNTRGTSDTTDFLQLYDLRSGVAKSVFKGNGASDFIFDECADNLAFTITENGIKRLAIYNQRTEKLHIVDRPFSTNEFSTEIWRFTSDCTAILFTLANAANDLREDNSGIRVWNYMDGYLYGDYQQKKSMLRSLTRLAVVDLATDSIKILTSGDQKVNIMPEKTDLAILTLSQGRRLEVPWNKSLYPSYLVCHIKSGKIDTIKYQSPEEFHIILPSPDNRYVVYYDPEFRSYFSFNTITNKSVNISNNIPENIFRYTVFRRGMEDNAIAGISGWIIDQNRVVIRTRFNLWSVDLNGKEQPVNLTSNCRTEGSTVFALQSMGLKFNSKDDVMITSFNFKTKATAFFKSNINKGICKQIFYTTDYLVDPYAYPYTRFEKARDADKYLFSTENASKLSNYIFTDNFNTYDTLSHVYPPSDYYWLTSEIISYKDSDGKDCEAVLYKPENFDPIKKYPVLINYYLDQTHWLNRSPSPKPDNTGFNVPLLLSNGFIVVRPNLYLERFKPGESGLKSVLALAKYLSTLSWVDSTKLGILGHSFGGFMTNYFVTHTNRFAAAISEAGVTNVVDGVTGMWGGKDAQVDLYTVGPFRMIKELNESPEIYVQNSPIMATANMNTPLLLTHNDDDNAVPVFHGQQLFIQLRRQGKPVWLIQYEREKHTVVREENQLDLQQKVLEFFNHYLKGESMPQWMINHN